MAKRKSCGLPKLVREVSFQVVDNQLNQKKAQQLIEKFSEMWAAAFHSFEYPQVEAQPWKKASYL